ncbi:hypothetical protein [Nostoc sp.]
MNKIVLAVLATALSTATTVAFSQSAKADSTYGHRSEYSREDYRNHHRGDRHWGDRHWGDRHRGDHPYYFHREYYPLIYDDEGYYRQSHSHLQLIIPLNFR